MSNNAPPEIMTLDEYRRYLGLENPIPTSPAKKGKRQPRATTGGKDGQPVTVTEHDIQSSFFAWAKWEGINRRELDLMYAVNNSSYRPDVTGGKLKKEGRKTGVPDVCLPVGRGGYHALYIEFKRKGNRPQAEQVKFIDALRSAGNYVAVCYSFDEAQKITIDYLDGVLTAKEAE